VDDHPLLATTAPKQPLPPTPLAAAARAARAAATALAVAAAAKGAAAPPPADKSSLGGNGVGSGRNVGGSGGGSSSGSGGGSSGSAAAATAAAVAEAAASRAEAAARAEAQGNGAVSEDPTEVAPAFVSTLFFSIAFLCSPFLSLFFFFSLSLAHFLWLVCLKCARERLLRVCILPAADPPTDLPRAQVGASSDLFVANGLRRGRRVTDDAFTPALRAHACGGLPPSVMGAEQTGAARQFARVSACFVSGWCVYLLHDS
jgi:hypothetical protein